MLKVVAGVVIGLSLLGTSAWIGYSYGVKQQKSQAIDAATENSSNALSKTTDLEAVSSVTGGLFDPELNDRFITTLSPLYPEMRLLDAVVLPENSTAENDFTVPEQMVVARYDLGGTLSVDELKNSIATYVDKTYGNLYYDHVELNTDSGGKMLTFHGAGGTNISYAISVGDGQRFLNLIVK